MNAVHWPLTDRCLIRVTGADATRYLNGQLSNDVRKLAPGEARQACLLTARGKLVATPFIWREDSAFVLEVPAECETAFLSRLERYLVADEVVIEKIEDPPVEYHFLGTENGSGRSINRVGIPGIDTPNPPAASRRLSADEVETLRIRHAVPAWGRELDENVLPAEAGLDRMAIDFHKGCYVGQEVVSRMETAGRVRRTLGVLQTHPRLPAGTSLQNAEGTAVGHITSAVAHESGGLALAWLHPAAALPGTRLKPVQIESDGLTEIKVIEKLP